MAARNLTVQFGLISIACKKESAVEKAASYRNMCVGQPGFPAHDPTPVTMPKKCTACDPGHETDITDFTVLKKGIPQGNSFAIVDQADIAEAKTEFADQYKGVVNLVPHPADELYANTAPGESVSFLTPADAANEDHYALMVKLLTEHPDVAFASLHTPVSKTGLYVVRAKDGVLLLEERARTQNLKQTPTCGGTVNEQLYNLLVPMMEASITPYDADKYEDEYASKVAELAAKADIVAAGTKKGDAGTGVTTPASDADLMAQLAALNSATKAS